MVEERTGFRVTGRVQGVGFRFWTRRTALELGVRGAVRNAGDGAVEVSVAGPPDAVSALERRLAQGPPGARVSGVVRAPSALRIPDRGFEIESSA